MKSITTRRLLSLDGDQLNWYLKEYKWANIFEMMRNLKSKPKIAPELFNNRLVVITGATSGIGLAAALKFASRGADLLVINRNQQKSIELCQTIQREYQVDCNFILADFAKLDDVHQAAHELKQIERNIDVLIHNAGIYNTTRVLTAEGLEAVFQTNFLSTFILNHILKEKFKKQAGGRILFVNSEAYRFAVSGLQMDDLSWTRRRYTGIQSYGAAKLAQLLSMRKFKDYFGDCGVTINAMHPGNVKTNSGQNNGRLYKVFKKWLLDRGMQPLDFAAEALYYLGVSDEIKEHSGVFFNLTTEEEPAPPARDDEAAQRLWEISLKLGGLHE